MKVISFHESDRQDHWLEERHRNLGIVGVRRMMENSFFNKKR